MTERTLPGIGLTGFWDQGAPWKVGGDQNWLASSVLTQLAVESATTALPASPLNGVIYIVPAAGSPANQIAARDNGAWKYYAPQKGWTAYVRDTNTLMNFDGASWVPSTAVLTASLAAAGGSAQVGFTQVGTGAQTRTVQAKLRELVSVMDFGAVGDGVVDDTVAINACAVATNGRGFSFGDGRTFLVSAAINLASYVGSIYCGSTIKAAPGVTIAQMINATSASLDWYGRTTLDVSQTASTVAGDARAQVGFYLRDARDCVIEDVNVINARVFRPVYVSGSSAIAGSVTAAMGAKRINITRVGGIAFPYATPDEGVYNIVSSDFFAGTNGGTCFTASNGVKIADYTVDATVALARTTEAVTFTDCTFISHDRIALLNCKGVSFVNCRHILGGTRGIDCSPTVEDVTWVGGHLSGGAAAVVGNYCCKNLNFSAFSVAANAATGQQRSFTFGVGTTDVNVSNITGTGGAQRHIVIEGAQRVSFTNVKLRNYLGAATTLAVSINGGLAANAATYVTDNITFDSCDLQANYALVFGENTGTATVALGAVTFQSTHFEKTNELFNTGLAAMPSNGQIRWINSTATKTGSAQDLSNASFMFYVGGNLNLQMWDTYTCGGATTYPIFPTVRYYVPERDGGGGDATRNPGLLAYIKKSGGTFYQPLLYGIDWFDDGTVAGTMYDRIRMYTPANTASGDVIAVQRIR